MDGTSTRTAMPHVQEPCEKAATCFSLGELRAWSLWSSLDSTKQAAWGEVSAWHMGGTWTNQVQTETPKINMLDSNRGAGQAQQDPSMKREVATGDPGYRHQQRWSERTKHNVRNVAGDMRQEQ